MAWTGFIRYSFGRFHRIDVVLQKVALSELLGFLDDGLRRLPAILCEDACTHILIRDLFTECLFQRIALDVKGQLGGGIRIVHKVFHLHHHVSQFSLVSFTQDRVRTN